ncbi:MAG: hypothetical protein ACM3UV_07865 [Nocardioidaceae bacterium]
MERARIDISRHIDGEIVVFACFDLDEREAAASAHAIAATGVERFRTSAMSADEVLELRELTALADELRERARGHGLRTIALRPGRLSVYRCAITRFVETRDESDWIRDEDREPVALLRGMLLPLEQLCAEAMRAALAPEQRIR